MKESRLWLLFMIAGIVLFIGLWVHLIGMHLSSFLGVGYETTLSFSKVLERGGSSWFALFYLILLLSALFHGFYGLRNIIIEFNLKESVEKLVSIIIVIIGIIFFAYGTYVIFAFLTKGV